MICFIFPIKFIYLMQFAHPVHILPLSLHLSRTVSLAYLPMYVLQVLYVSHSCHEVHWCFAPFFDAMYHDGPWVGMSYCLIYHEQWWVITIFCSLTMNHGHPQTIKVIHKLSRSSTNCHGHPQTVKVSHKLSRSEQEQWWVITIVCNLSKNNGDPQTISIRSWTI